MKSFEQFNIKLTTKGFEGDKIKMSKILNKVIIVYYYKIEDSKVYKDRGTCKCLQLQISINEIKHIIFTASSGLIEMIQQVPEDGFPFETTIVQDNDRFKFT